MKYRSRRNFGYGRSMKYAIRNVLADGYGDGHYSTQRTHADRLRQFVDFLKGQDVKDIRSIDREHVVAYASHLREICEEYEISIATAQNRLSSVNVLMTFVSKGQFRAESPSKLLGRRSYVRLTEPSGLFQGDYLPALEDLKQRKEWRLALLVGLCRFAGARFREASLLDLTRATRQAVREGTVTIRRGSKGGRAKTIPRVITARPELAKLLSEATVRLESLCLVPDDKAYIQWYGWAHRNWRKLAPSYGLSTKYHELRASYACERFEHLTGDKAPCVTRPGASTNVRPEGERLSAADARELIALELGHNRVEIVNGYCGSLK